MNSRKRLAAIEVLRDDHQVFTVKLAGRQGLESDSPLVASQSVNTRIDRVVVDNRNAPIQVASGAYPLLESAVGQQWGAADLAGIVEADNSVQWVGAEQTLSLTADPAQTFTLKFKSGDTDTGSIVWSSDSKHFSSGTTFTISTSGTVTLSGTSDTWPAVEELQDAGGNYNARLHIDMDLTKDGFDTIVLITNRLSDSVVEFTPTGSLSDGPAPMQLMLATDEVDFYETARVIESQLRQLEGGQSNLTVQYVGEASSGANLHDFRIASIGSGQCVQLLSGSCTLTPVGDLMLYYGTESLLIPQGTDASVVQSDLQAFDAFRQRNGNGYADSCG